MFLFFLYVYYFSCEKDKHIILNNQIIKKLLRLFNISFFCFNIFFLYICIRIENEN